MSVLSLVRYVATLSRRRNPNHCGPAARSATVWRNTPEFESCLNSSGSSCRASVACSTFNIQLRCTLLHAFAFCSQYATGFRTLPVNDAGIAFANLMQKVLESSISSICWRPCSTFLSKLTRISECESSMFRYSPIRGLKTLTEVRIRPMLYILYYQRTGIFGPLQEHVERCAFDSKSIRRCQKLYNLHL